MAEGTEVHPGSFVGDSIEEWKKLPTWGKFVAVAVLAAIAYLAIRARQQTAQQAASSTASSPTAGTQSPFPMVGNLPVLPSNVNPVYDSSGNPVAFQQAPPPAPPPPLQGGNPPTQGQLSPWTPLIPQGQYTGPQGSIAPGTKYTYGGQTYQLGQGSNGIVWGVPVSQGQTLSNSAWSNTPIAIGQKQVLYGNGAGGPTSSYMANPNTYHQAATPHVTSASPYGGL